LSERENKAIFSTLELKMELASTVEFNLKAEFQHDFNMLQHASTWKK
jgi:hypothetical protein